MFKSETYIKTLDEPKSAHQKHNEIRGRFKNAASNNMVESDSSPQQIYASLISHVFAVDLNRLPISFFVFPTLYLSNALGKMLFIEA